MIRFQKEQGFYDGKELDILDECSQGRTSKDWVFAWVKWETSSEVSVKDHLVNGSIGGR